MRSRYGAIREAWDQMARVEEALGLGIQSVGGAVRSRPWGEDLCVESLAAPAALVHEDAFDIALAEEASAASAAPTKW